jgi:hypothetical protein
MWSTPLAFVAWHLVLSIPFRQINLLCSKQEYIVPGHLQIEAVNNVEITIEQYLAGQAAL